jgi:hypothetical protein
MSDSLLRLAIRMDVTGVGLLGLGAAVFAGPLARLTGLTPLQCYVTAAGFLFYGVIGNLLARSRRVVGTGMGLSAFNFLGTIGALALVASAALPLTSAGKTVVLACGAYTLAFGVMQFLGVRRAKGVRYDQTR